MTARDSVMDRVAGLDQGADDYVVKPFEIEEILARPLCTLLDVCKWKEQSRVVKQTRVEYRVTQWRWKTKVPVRRAGRSH